MLQLRPPVGTFEHQIPQAVDFPQVSIIISQLHSVAYRTQRKQIGLCTLYLHKKCWSFGWLIYGLPDLVERQHDFM